MALRGTASATSATAATTLAITVSGIGGSGPQNGDIVILSGVFGGSSTLTISSSGFTAIPGISNVGLATSNNTFFALYKIAGASEPSSYTVSKGAGADFGSIQCNVFSGRSIVSPFTAATSVAATLHATPIGIAVPTLTAAGGDDLLFLCGEGNNITSGGSVTFTLTVPSGFTNKTDTNTAVASVPATHSCSKQAIAAGATGTITGSVAWTGSAGSDDGAGYLISLASNGTLVGQDGSSWVSSATEQENSANGYAVASGGTPFWPGVAGTATTAWLNVAAGSSANTVKICLYDAGGNLIATSAAIGVTSAGLKSGAISATITAQNYSLVVVPDSGVVVTTYQVGSNGFLDKQWTAGHFSYTSPPAVLPAVDASVGHAFIVYLTAGGNAYNLACSTTTYATTIESLSFGASTAVHNYVMPATAVVFDRLVGISSDDQLLRVSATTYSLSIGQMTFHPQGLNLAVADVVFSGSIGSVSFTYVPGNLLPVVGGVPCSYDFSSYPAFRTVLQQMIDGDDASTSSLSVSILDLIISFGERRIYRDVRSNTQDTALALTVTGNSAPVPIDLIELRSVFVATGVPAQYLPYEAFQFKQQRAPRATSMPWYYTFEGENMVFYPSQQDGTIISGRYLKRFCSIVTEGLVGNTFFNRYPDLWLYACLVEAAPYVGEMSRMAEWKERYSLLAESAAEYEKRRFTRGSKLQTRLS